MPRKTKHTISLEDYAFFLEDPFNDAALTTDQLKEIVFMHGFKKMHRVPKREVLDALSTIDLINPQRSTLNDNCSPYAIDASLSLVEAQQDLESLKWQECTVQSIETVRCSLQDDPATAKPNGSDVVSKSFAGSSFKQTRKKRSKRVRKLRSINDNGASPGSTGGVGADVASGVVAQCGSFSYVDTYSWGF